MKSSLRDVRRKKLRVFLTVLGIAIGVASVVVISGISQCGADAVNSEMNSLGLDGLLISKSGKVGNASLTSQDLALVSQLSNVDCSAPLLMNSGRLTARGSSTDAILWGIDSHAGEVVSISPVYGRLFNRKEIGSAANVCLVDESFSKKAYGRKNIVGKTVTVACGKGTQEFEVIGVIRTGTGLLQNVIGNYIPTFVYLPYTTMQIFCGRNDFDDIIVRLKPGAESSAAGRQIAARLDASKGTAGAFLANDLAKQKDGLLRIMDLVTLILSAVGAVSLLVASLSIMTMMTVSVTERTREIGIKKALGAARANIMAEFLMEACLLSAFGSVLGCAAGYGISLAVAALFHVSSAVRGDIMLAASGIAILSGTIFSVYPAYLASRLRPVDALRQE